jgi:hypothetical protein
MTLWVNSTVSAIMIVAITACLAGGLAALL